MPHSPTINKKSTRFSLERAVLNIRDMIYKTGTRQKEVAFAIGITESQFTQKMRNIRNRFTIDELGRTGDFFAHRIGKPLTGWPLYEERYADLIDAGLSCLKRR